jgi:hypothetical protein
VNDRRRHHPRLRSPGDPGGRPSLRIACALPVCVTAAAVPADSTTLAAYELGLHRLRQEKLTTQCRPRGQDPSSQMRIISPQKALTLGTTRSSPDYPLSQRRRKHSRRLLAQLVNCRACTSTARAPKPPLSWEPVSGFEPLPCRLQEVRPHAPHALPAQMTRVIAADSTRGAGIIRWFVPRTVPGPRVSHPIFRYCA